MSSAAGPSTAPQRDGSSKPGGMSRYQQNNLKFGTPLPILLPCSPLHPAYIPPKQRQEQSFLSSLIPRIAPRAIVPEIKGIWDEDTRSVWVEDKEDMNILFRRGFFGKGTLSRSEPTWRERRLDLLKGGDTAAAEKIREKRRIERKQFKIDRAQAMLDAAKAAEAIITTGQAPSTHGDDEAGEKDLEAEVAEQDGLASPTTTATGDIVDVSTLTAQTFLVRPTRPDANRNRGRNAFKRKPKPKPPVTDQAQSAAPVPQEAPIPQDEGEEEEEELVEEGFDEELVQEMEHLQLSPEEAWFLCAGLGVLRIYDPKTDTLLSLDSVLPLLITPTLIPSAPRVLPDDPFLVSYACYHHFRTLGWVVKSGIKFCCDWLLYRRGPVFSHAAFSIVMVPVYEDDGDRERSPYGHEDWYEERMSWKWMNTVMRVNSLVQKTVIMVYITIPSLASIEDKFKLADGSLDPRKNDMRSLIERYQIREVSLTRFGPARRRD